MKQNERNKKMYYDLFYPYHPILGLQNGTHTFSINGKFERKKTKIPFSFVYIWSRIWFGTILCGQIEPFIHIRKVCVLGQLFFVYRFFSYSFDMNELSYKGTISQKLTISREKNECLFA